ncbi:MAG: Hsp20/alpha crystallin family protein [Patescibacteria group bacterium]|jgi:HSP20 family protein
MSIIKWQPLVEPWDELERWFGNAAPMARGGMMPAVDVYQTKNDVVIEAPLPGLKAEDVTLSIENDVLTIEGKVEHKSEIDDKEYYRREVRMGSFHRAVALPTSVQSDKADAKFEDGVLKVVIPKAEHAKPKTIDIKVVKKN